MKENQIMSDAVKQRTALRGWVTRTSRKLDSVCMGKQVDKYVLTDLIEEFDKHMDKLDNVQSQIEIEMDIDQLDQEIDSAGNFRDKVRIPRIEAGKLLGKMLDNKANPASDHGSHISTTKEANLPKLELPTFSGEVTEWQTFWDQFCAVVDNSDLPEVSKFSYLLSLLKGDAKLAIQGLSLTAGHYTIACQILCERFGRKERIIFAHIQNLLNVSTPSANKNKVSSLWTLQDDLLAHIRSLEALGVTGSQYGVILTPLILSRLPQDIRMEWAREGEGHESDLSWLLEFLKKEIQRRERSQTFRETPPASEKTQPSVPEERRRVASVATLSSFSDSRCGICHKPHQTERCWDLTNYPISVRRDKILKAGLCFRCLGQGHIARACEQKCFYCKRGHHALLCSPSTSVKTFTAEPHSQNVPVSHSVTTRVSSVNTNDVKTRILLQSASVEVRGQKGVTRVNVLFDTGSDRSYISGDLVQKVGPEWVGTQSVSYAAFGSKTSSKSELRNMFQVNLKGSGGTSEFLTVTEVPVICAPLFRPEIPRFVMESLGGVELATHDIEGKHISVDILVGLDSYWKFVKPGITTLPGGLVAQETVFGSILSGPLPSVEVSTSAVSHQLLCVNDLSDSTLQKFWDLESIGISEKVDVEIDPILQEFEETVVFRDDRYEVTLPWKSGFVDKLQDNEMQARSRLAGLTRKLSKTPELDEAYNKAIQEMEENGVIEEVPQSELVSSYPVFYMPHRPVIRESSISTKIRPVFDASASGANGLSLNDCMHKGPNLIPNLAEMLIRFRRWKVALTADITKAFLQVGVRQEDQDVHRFLWNDHGDVKVMRFVRVPFGNRCSPFLLNATIQHHLSSVPSTPVIEEMKENFYVDDLLTGGDDEQGVCDMLSEATSVMAKASMKLAKVGSNSERVYQEVDSKFQETIKVLGLKWVPTSDTFTFEVMDIPSDIVVTKRVVLSFISRLFDPLGFLTPVIMLAKCLFQDLWREGLDWDDEIPVPLQQVFLQWVEGLRHLRDLSIPRSYSGFPWSDMRDIELHAFGDASEKGYGACVYLRYRLPNGNFDSVLIISKARVAPLKKLTLPRLELLGALLCARLLVFVRKALKLPTEVESRCWTDSTIVLTWIKGDLGRWKMFVENRVKEILTLTSPLQWGHCPGKYNPADLVTRGVFPEDLLKSNHWIHGPDFLSSPLRSSEIEVPECSFEELACDEVSPNVTLLSVEDKSVPDPIDMERWGSFQKSIRVVAWVLRFIHNVRNKSQVRKGDLVFSEMSEAKMKVFQLVQQCHYQNELTALKQGKEIPKNSSIRNLNPFLGKDGLLRVRGRLQMSDFSFEEKHPIILPKCHTSMLIVRFHHNLLKHVGIQTILVSLRNHYWIVGVRRIAKLVKKQCIACQKQDAQASSQPVAPLPELRVKPAPPFAIVGIDHTGALFCCDLPGKFYVLLFTCAVVRAVHLELVDSLSVKDTLLALRRFAARRGVPSVIYSDNAKGFQGTSRQ